MHGASPKDSISFKELSRWPSGDYGKRWKKWNDPGTVRVFAMFSRPCQFFWNHPDAFAAHPIFIRETTRSGSISPHGFANVDEKSAKYPFFRNLAPNLQRKTRRKGEWEAGTGARVTRCALPGFAGFREDGKGTDRVFFLGDGTVKDAATVVGIAVAEQRRNVT